MPRIGLVSYWFNRGQAVVTRRLRGVLDSLGHETHVLARPTKNGFVRPAYVERHDVWDQPNVTAASHFAIPWDDYERWLDATSVDAVLFFQNYGFDEVRQIRTRGVRTIGCFMWEAFGPEHVTRATDSFDAVYSLTRCGRQRYAALGLDTAYVPWGCHPDEIAARRAPNHGDAGDLVTFYVPGGYVSRRKPMPEIIDAFMAVGDPRQRLVIKLQGSHAGAIAPSGFDARITVDHRISIAAGDLPARSHAALFAAADVCLAPSRWEGLGLHLYEAAAYGMPTITTAAPPMDEVVEDGVNGVLTRCSPGEPTPSGVLAVEPDPAALRDALRSLADDGVRARLAAGARAAATGRLSWQRTASGVRDLLAQVGVT